LNIERVSTEVLDFVINGSEVSIEIEPSMFLLDVIRDQLGLTGAKRSCDMQVCGTCTVLMDGAPVSSCTLLAHDARSKQVVTIEGLSSGESLHPLQKSFLAHGGLQCGFCTPGMILAAVALLNEIPNPSREEISSYMDGNICRCTGYVKIIESVQSAALDIELQRS
jgi:aerobic-type carbon monoxide dehydrogenase small subunit (CoxS/CutS family)